MLNKYTAKIINGFLKDKQTYIISNQEIIDGKEIEDWVTRQGIGYFVFIPKKDISTIRQLLK